jgi:hypothetical protein
MQRTDMRKTEAIETKFTVCKQTQTSETILSVRADASIHSHGLIVEPESA